MKNGKKPLSQKPKPASLQLDDIFGNPLSVSEDVKKHCAETGMEYRFVDAKKLNDMGNYHPRGWTAYRKPKDIMNNQEPIFGSDPGGLVRRGSLVLAVRPVAVGTRHREVLQQRADAAKSINRRKADELKQMSADAQIYEGFEDNDTDE